MKGNESAAESLLVAIVDDDACMRTSTRRLIRSLGFGAEVFASAREFLDSGCLSIVRTRTNKWVAPPPFLVEIDFTHSGLIPTVVS
jgi:hypothetical protein